MGDHYYIQELISTATSEGESVGDLSDGYHTFNELYEHRIELYITLCRMLAAKDYNDYPVWRAKAHYDGEEMMGWFLLGINYKPGRVITYHLPMIKWDETNFAATLSVGVEWDGHTSADVLKRLKDL